MDDSINLRTLKKNDENIEEILTSAGQVAIYKFQVASRTWERTEIEGPLFFVRRKGPHEYGFFVINRLNTTNLAQQITSDLETSMVSPYLMYKSPNHEIYCIWFYDADNLIAFNDEINKVINKLKMGNSVGRNHVNVNCQQDLLSYLNNCSNSNTNNKHSNNISNNLNFSNNINNVAKEHTSTPVKSQSKAINLVDLFNQTNLANSYSKFIEAGGDSNSDSQLPEASLINKQDTRDATDFSKLINSLADINLQKVSSFLKADQPRLQQPKQRQQSAGQSTSTPNEKATTKPSLPSYLSMEQLKQTLIYLLKHDADFLHGIHSAYVASLKK